MDPEAFSPILMQPTPCPYAKPHNRIHFLKHSFKIFFPYTPRSFDYFLQDFQKNTMSIFLLYGLKGVKQ